MGRDITFDFAAGGGSDDDFIIGSITLEPTMVHEVGTRVVLPAPRSTGISAGVGVINDVAVSPDGPEPAWAYRATAYDSVSGRKHSWFVGVPSGTAPIAFSNLPVFITTIPPETTPGMMQNWADTAQDGARRAEEAADRAEAPTDLMVSNLVNNESSLAKTALNGKFVRAGSGGLLVDVKAPPFNAKGDGVTDDYDAITSAIATGKVVYFPPGIYLIRDELKVPSSRILFGAGIDISTIKVSASAPSASTGITNSLNSRNEHTIENTGIHISDMTVDANGWNRTISNMNQPSQSAIVFACVSHSSLTRVKAVNGGLHGIDITASVYRNSTMGWAVGPSHDIVLNQCESWNPRYDDGITTHHSYAIQINNCHAENTTDKPEFQQNGFEIDEGSRDVTLTNCTSRGFSQGYQVKGHAGSQPAEDVTFINCTASKCNHGWQIWWAAADSEQHRGGNITLIGCSADGLELRSDAAELQTLTALRTEFYANVKVINFRVKNTPNGGFIRVNKWCENVEFDGVTFENSLNGAAVPAESVIKVDNRNRGRVGIRNIRANGVKRSVVEVQGNPNYDTRYEVQDIMAYAHADGVADPVVKMYASRPGMSVKNIRRTGFTKNFQFFSGFLSGIGGDFDYTVRDTQTMLMPVTLLNGFTGTVEYSRDGNMVTVMVYTLTPATGTNTTVTVGNIPLGFRPPTEVPIILHADDGQSRNVWIASGGDLRGVFDSSLGRVRGSVTYCV